MTELIVVKLSEILNSQNALSELIDMKLPAKISFRLAKILKQAQEEVNVFNETKERLIKTYGEPDEKGNYVIKESSEHYPKVVNEITECLESEITLNGSKIRIEDLGDIEIEVKTILSLSYLFEE